MKQVIWSNWNHEPIDHLRRLGEFNTSIFTLGEWLPEWYDRIHSEELIKKGAEMGINTIYTHFFKGFGLIHEHDDMEKMRELCKIAHKYGVEVIGYMDFGTLFYETLLDEIPNLDDWIAVDRAGNQLEYGEHYYRVRPCLESREFIDYLKEILLYGINHVGLDGFHFDGARARECYCERCQESFRKYLTDTIKNPRELVGLANFNHVKLPPVVSYWTGTVDEVHDILTLYKGRFRHLQLYRAQKELFDFIKANGGKYVLHNPGLLRPDFGGYFDPQLNPDSCDFVFGENNNFIVHREDKNVHQVLAYKVAERFNFKLFDAPWLHTNPKPVDDSDVVIPKEKSIIDRFLAQGMIFGNISGAPWFVRSQKMGSKVTIDDENHYNTTKNAFDYFKQNAELYDSKTDTKVKLLYATDTFYGYVKTGYVGFQNIANDLTKNGVPYSIITEDQIDGVSKGEVIVLPNYRYAPTSQYEKIKSATERGVRVLMVGSYGLYTENGKERDHRNPIRNLQGLDNVLTEIPDDVKIKTDVSDALLEIRKNTKGNYVFHVLRIDNEDTLKTAEFEFNSDLFGNEVSAKLYSIDPDCALDSVTIKDGVVKIKIKNLTTMASIEFSK